MREGRYALTEMETWSWTRRLPDPAEEALRTDRLVEVVEAVEVPAVELAGQSRHKRSEFAST